MINNALITIKRFYNWLIDYDSAAAVIEIIENERPLIYSTRKDKVKSTR